MRVVSKDKTIRSILKNTKQSAFSKYKYMVVGDKSLFHFMIYELFLLFIAPLPGGFGILLRQKLYPLIFKSVGKNVIIAKNCEFRYPLNITIGNNIVIDDNVLIDARGAHAEGVVLEDGVIVNKNTTIKAKKGNIIIRSKTTIGANSSLISWDGLEIGEGCFIAPACYFSPSQFDVNDVSSPFLEKDAFCRGPIVIEDNVWVATRVTILDSVRIGRDSIISAGSIVSKNVPVRSVVQGNPGKVIFTRR